MKRFFLRIPFYCFFFFLLFSTSVKAGDPGGPSGSGDPGCDPSCNCRPDGTWCPIDNEVYLLLLTGVGYGVKKLRDSRKTSAYRKA